MAWKDLTLEEYTRALAQPNAAPAGGSACAVAGALAASLAAMTAALGMKAGAHAMDVLQQEAVSLQQSLLQAAQEDSDAYTAYMEARRRARIAEEWAAPDEALAYASQVPLDVAAQTLRVIELTREALPHCPPHARPDGAAGISLAQAAVRASLLNARANAMHLSNADLKKDILSQASALESKLERS